MDGDEKKPYLFLNSFLVKIPVNRKPQWATFTEEVTGKDLNELSNRSSSALLVDFMGL